MMAWEREVASVVVYLRSSPDPRVREALELERELGVKGQHSLDTQAREVMGKYRLDPIDPQGSHEGAQEDAFRETWYGKLIREVRPESHVCVTKGWKAAGPHREHGDCDAGW